MLLLRGATRKHAIRAHRWGVSIHAPLARSNFWRMGRRLRRLRFQYMLLLRGATLVLTFCTVCFVGFNTCSSCEEQLDGADGVCGAEVSIHAPLARSNKVDCLFCCCLFEFQYMLLLRGATLIERDFRICHVQFQYMLLLRGATES